MATQPTVPRDFGVVLFESTQGAIKGERALQHAGFTPKLIPVPRHLSSDCGVCLRFSWPEYAGVEQALRAGDVQYVEIRRLA